jgi:MFS family permease
MSGRNNPSIENGATIGTISPKVWGLTLFLTCCYTLSLVDRFILAFLAPSIRHDLELSDLQMGLVQGFAFSILYAVAGLPLGVAVDRFKRMNVVAGAVAVWSAMTVACGLTTGFGGLLAARVGVGVGEAALTPASYSIFGDVFSRRRMPLAASIYNLAPPIATACAAGLSGLVLSAAGPDGTILLPYVGFAQGWRIVMIGIGLPGVLVALVALAIKEPARLIQRCDVETGSLAPFMRRNWRLHAIFMIAAMFSALAGYAANAWSPSVLERAFYWSPKQTGAALGSVAFFFGVLGNVLGGVLSGWIVSKGQDEAILFVAAGAMIVQAAAGTALFFVRTGEQFLIIAGVDALVLSMIFTIAGATIQLITPSELRGRVTALALFILIGVGAGGGPFAVGAINTLIWNDQRLGSALALILVAASVTSAALFFSCSKPMRLYLNLVA